MSDVHAVDAAAKGRSARRRGVGRPRLDVLAVIAAGGVLGAEARYGLGVLLPHTGDAWPWSTLLINVSGCVLIGGLMVMITELLYAHRLIRPFLGVGLLGGYTTFSTATVEALTLMTAGRPGAAVGYLVATPTLAVLGCAVGVVATRLLAGRSLRRPAGAAR
jgi:fluoride exporter